MRQFWGWMMSYRLIFVVIFGVLCACSPSSPLPQSTETPPPPIIIPAETPIIPAGALLLAQAEQAEAPAIAWMPNALLVTWIGTDDLDIRHFAQWRFNDQWQNPQTLSLLTNRPHAQQLVITADNVTYLFWLDALPEFPEPQQVWYAPISKDYSINPGALALSNTETAEFTALAHPDGGIWVVWRGGLHSEPTLYAQYINSLGRPRLPEAILENATHPVLRTDADGEQWLFWIKNNHYLWGAKWDNGILTDAHELAQSVILSEGDLLEHFTVGIAGDDAFAFWHISRRDGSYQSYYMMGSLTAPNWGSHTPYPHDAMWLTPNQAIDNTIYAVGVTTSTPYDLRIYQWNGDSWWAKREGVIIPSGLLRPPTWMRFSDEQAILAWSQPNGLSANLWVLGAD